MHELKLHGTLLWRRIYRLEDEFEKGRLETGRIVAGSL